MNEWIIEVKSEITKSLEESFRKGPILNDRGMRRLEEKLVGKIKGLKVEIFSHEHPPPHFKVTYQGESNNFSIDDSTPLNGTRLKKWFRNIKKWHLENKDTLIKYWNENRPTDCPVGKYKGD